MSKLVAFDLKGWRIRNALTQAQVCKAWGITATTLWRMERAAGVLPLYVWAARGLEKAVLEQRSIKAANNSEVIFVE
jgi:hypothetical protein